MILRVTSIGPDNPWVKVQPPLLSEKERATPPLRTSHQPPGVNQPDCPPGSTHLHSASVCLELSEQV